MPGCQSGWGGVAGRAFGNWVPTLPLGSTMRTRFCWSSTMITSTGVEKTAAGWCRMMLTCAMAPLCGL